MTQVNNPNDLTGGDLFGYKIKYNQVEGLENPNTDFLNLQVKPKYNGNIAEIDWRTNTTTGDNLRRYGYVYDGLNRLKAGFYQRDDNPTAKEYFEKIDYDLNGNITNLKRSASKDGNAFATAIDNLDYVYENNNQSNRLSTVTDTSQNYKGYPDTSGNAITYDLNGNMKSHKDKNILEIRYNYLNLPNYIKSDQFVATGGRQAEIYLSTTNTYRADGIKLKKIYTYKDWIVTNFIAKTETDYLDGFQYEKSITFSYSGNPELKFVPTSEGYFNFENNKYIYNYTDHLGNVRLSYFNNGTSAEVLEENNYYPFGLKHEGYNPTAGNPSYQYKYNGKELQETGMYDYGARFYMPDIGRWGVVDPRSQYTQETYSYVWNNPITFADPTGMSGEEVSDWIHNPTTNRYRWDPNVTRKSNTPEGWNYVGPTGSYRIDGATVQLLEGGKTFTDIDEVVTKGVSPVAAASVMSRNAQFALFSFFAVASWYVIGDFIDTNETYQPTRIDPMMYRHTDNAESNAGSKSSAETDSTDVNGVKVPQEGKPDARYDPKDLQEQLAIEEAESGEGDTIMSGKLKDPKYNHNTKMKHTHDHGDGTKTEVHYDINNQTGKRSGFKIKDGTNAKSRGHRYP
ncbi:RHS repeat-associated core domain-containing protein [Chryseobacterium sp. GP-SGM7]|uniref:RHS repeat-associated core domain-containing protein n=1 Tax=Chryseobacterium sp. GP-SGM7 TaxID=3411323 RepID=UPI003B933EFC